VRAACAACVRRCRLLAELGPLLDYRCTRPDRLAELLALEDGELIDSLGGRRRQALREWQARPGAGQMDPPGDGLQVCRHDERYPPALCEPWAPAVLTVLGGAERFAEMLARPAVAILDSAEASDYGRAMTISLARGLAASGVTVVAAAGGQIARAAHEGAAETGRSLVVLGRGLAVPGAGHDPTTRLALEDGCAVSELPWESAGRRWGPVACGRTVAGLGAVTIVVESAGGDRDLWTTRLAGPLGAVPGMVTNPFAAGPHTLLAAGARLIGEAKEVLDLLHDSGAPRVAPAEAAAARTLPRHLGRLLDLVGAGVDTPERLSGAAGEGSASTRAGAGITLGLMASLGELEAIGAIARTAQGRYVRSDPARPDWL